MTKDDIIRMAREQIVCNVMAAAGDCDDYDYKQFAFNVAIKVAELIAVAEREACAKVCEFEVVDRGCQVTTRVNCAAAIRARGQE